MVEEQRIMERMTGQTGQKKSEKPTTTTATAPKAKTSRRKCPYYIQYEVPSGDGGGDEDSWRDFDISFADTEEAKQWLRKLDPKDKDYDVLFDNDIRIVSVKWDGSLLNESISRVVLK